MPIMGPGPLGFANATQPQGTQTPSSESATSPGLGRALAVPCATCGFRPSCTSYLTCDLNPQTGRGSAVLPIGGSEGRTAGG